MGNPETLGEFAATGLAVRVMRVLVIDEQSLFVASFGAALLRCASHISLINVPTGDAAHIVLCDGRGVDLVLLNLQRADGTGFEMLAALRNAHHAVPVLVTSGIDTNAEIVRAIYFGATGFVPVGGGSAMFLEALDAVGVGRIFMPPMFVRSPPSRSCSSDGARLQANDARNQESAVLAEPSRWRLDTLGLTRRQREVLVLLMDGQSNKAIARLLNLSVDTIKDHVAALLRILNVRSRTQVVLAVSRMTEYAQQTPTGVNRPLQRFAAS